METVTCKACMMHDYTGNKDLDPNVHSGFTVGKGKKLYWYFIWHTTGNATVYAIEGNGKPMKKRFIRGNQIIHVHFLI